MERKLAAKRLRQHVTDSRAFSVKCLCGSHLDRFARLPYHFCRKGARRVKTEVSIEYCVV